MKTAGVLEIRLPQADKAGARKIEVKAQLPQGEPTNKERKPGQKKT